MTPETKDILLNREVIAIDQDPAALPAKLVSREGTSDVIARTPIEIGLRTGSEVEVVSGLSEGDAIIPKNPASLKDGQRAEVIQ